MSRKDKKGYVLHKGESQRADGRYVYTYTDRYKNRRYVYARSLAELREKERSLNRDYEDGLDPAKSKNLLVNHMVENYLELKHDLKKTTRGSYLNVYRHYIKDSIGKCKIVGVKYSDIKKYYYSMILDHGLNGTTVDHIHCVLHPAFQMAVRDGVIRTNPTDGVMAEIKRSKYWKPYKRVALTIPEQKELLRFLNESKEFSGWCPLITILLGTGMRIGECLGLTWSDLDFKDRMIDVNHAFNDRPDETGKTRKRIQDTKTNAGTRTIPMIDEVYDAFLTEYEYQKILGFCEEEIDGYTGFVFITSQHTVILPEAVNRAIHCIVNKHNEEETLKAKEEGRKPILLPDFTAHVLRHTFCTRLCENESNTLFIKDVMGHADINTTMNIYADITNEKKKEVMSGLQGKII